MAIVDYKRHLRVTTTTVPRLVSKCTVNAFSMLKASISDCQSFLTRDPWLLPLKDRAPMVRKFKNPGLLQVSFIKDSYHRGFQENTLCSVVPLGNQGPPLGS